MRDAALRLGWADDVIMTKADVLGLLCVFAPEQVLAALQGMIADQSPANAMPAAERDTQVAKIEGRLFELELQEEGLITRAAQDGLDVPRRGDADPRAVLGVTVRSCEAQAA